MRLSGLYTVVAISAAAFVLSACSSRPEGGSQTGYLPTQSSLFAVNLLSHTPQSSNAVLGATGARRLYVDDVHYYDYHNVDVLKYGGKFQYLGSIGNIGSPWGNWVDKAGNFYLADIGNSDVDEYNSSETQIDTYSSGLQSTHGVTTDKYGNVYVVDVNGVHEFPQGHNISFSCTGYNAGGVAVDKTGNVFVSTGSSILEYQRGLFESGCVDTVLVSSFNNAAGMALDTASNLVVCDQYGGVVDILAPPYTAITGTLGSGWSQPTNVTIDRQGTRAYVVDTTTYVVKILNYPSGTVFATLNGSNGLLAPFAAVDSENYVP